MEILEQIQTELISQDVSLTTTLRKAKVLASQLDSSELDSWVSHELDGYNPRDELPDYRIIRTYCFGTLTDGIHLIHSRQVPLSEIKGDRLIDVMRNYRVPSGIRKIELTAAKMTTEKEAKLYLPADAVALVNGHREQVHQDGFYYSQIFYNIGNQDFEQILDTVKTRLLDYVLKLSKNWHLETQKPTKDELNQLFNLTIHNEGGSMSIFDQRGQQVNYQYNAAGNINFQNVQDKDQLAVELGKLKEEIERAKQLKAMDNDIAVEAEFHLLQAEKEAKKDNPSKNQFLEHINGAKALLEGVASAAGMITALLKTVEIANQIFR